MKANWDEARQSQLAAVELLVNMGYKYLSNQQLKAQRREDNSKFILQDIAKDSLAKINKFRHKDSQYSFTELNIQEAIDELENTRVEGLQDTARKVYHLMMTDGGKTFPVLIEGKRLSQNFKYIDFENPENNSYHVAVEVPINGKNQNIRPDIVCYINGIPFVVIENKKSGTNIKDAVQQMNRNQTPDYCPKFFLFTQLLIATNVTSCQYGTTGTPEKFYAAWKEKELEKDVLNAKVKTLTSTSIDTEIYSEICSDLNGSTINHSQLLNREVTEQDRTLFSLLKPERLLDLTKHYMLFDGGVKKIARYQQYFSVNKIIKKVEQKDIQPDGSERRRGGMIWHTQGSGKSLTMVLLVKALIENPNIINPRILIITDRIDLDKQLSSTFKNCNLKKDVIKTKTGKELLKLIKEKSPAVITSLVHKFDSLSSKRKGFVDDDPNIFVLIDEAHRTQYGIASEEMRRLIPNACFLGFTGTPLLKKDKSQNRFGGFIDKYTIDDALDDGVILPLIYEGRYSKVDQNQSRIDRDIDRTTESLSDKARKKVQRFINKNIIRNNPSRIQEIALDIEDHFVENFQGTGLKAQIVAPSKYSAIVFQSFFESSMNIKSAVVMSESQTYEEDANDHKKEVAQYLKSLTDDYKDLQSYETKITEDFKDNPDGVEVLIVIDKLLTGFDAPRNTVLYLAKDLKDHNLLQAIARVNRLFDNDEKPKTVGYIIDYSENAQNIKSAMDLFGSFDEEDIKSVLVDSDSKINDLNNAYADLENHFKQVENKKDSESYLTYLGENMLGEQRRNEFYSLFNNFLKTFNECMSLQDFASTCRNIDLYKLELKRYAELRKTSQLKFADTADLTEYKNQLVKILDKYVQADQVELLTEQININDSLALDNALEKLHSDQSKAEAIASQMQRTIVENVDKDPEYYQRFSQKVSDVIKKMHEGKMTDILALEQLKLFKEDMLYKKDDSLPAELSHDLKAGIIYRNLKNTFTKLQIDDNQISKIIIDMLKILKQETIIDWQKQIETQRVIKNKLDDYLYDIVKIEMDIDLDKESLNQILDTVMTLALENNEIF